MANKKIIGTKAEQKAASYLQDKGFIILERNWRSGRNEIDIIAQKANLLVFLEVKFRSSSKFGFPEQSLSEAQMDRIRICAEEYMSEKNWKKPIRFDVIAFLQTKNEIVIEHFEDAF